MAGYILIFIAYASPILVDLLKALGRNTITLLRGNGLLSLMLYAVLIGATFGFLHLVVQNAYLSWDGRKGKDPDLPGFNKILFGGVCLASVALFCYNSAPDAVFISALTRASIETLLWITCLWLGVNMGIMGAQVTSILQEWRRAEAALLRKA